MDEKRNRFIFGAARTYLLQFENVTNDMIDKQLNEWRKGKRNSINELLLGMLNSVKNRRGMPGAIGDIEKLRPYLEDFAPSRIVEKYGDDWKKLFRTIQGDYAPPGRMAIDIPQNYWRVFCKAAISASNFLSRYAGIEEFNEFVHQFYLNEYSRVALPLLIDKEVFGFGFALACDFLKENGYNKFIKPDGHIKAIFKGIGITKSEDDYEVFKNVIRFSESINEIPYEVDKLFWLVGSGNFYLSEPKIKLKTNREDFIKLVKDKALNFDN